MNEIPHVRPHGTRIFFWSTERPPQLFAPSNMPAADRAALAKVLAAGHVEIGYLGHARCRICGARLGSRDLHGFGFTWPERAEHYVEAHDVWPPGASDLLAASRLNPRTDKRR